jgi:hypothetical protein
MIVAVRIAPVEQWKEKHPNLVGKIAPGTPVYIYPESMWWDYADGAPPFRSWKLAGESLEFFRKVDPSGSSICEHLLEMD